MERRLHQCADCGLEVKLRSPAERHCPNCGGRFVEVWDKDIDLRIEHPLKTRTPWSIEQQVREQFPAIMEGLEDYLAERTRNGN